MPVINLRSYSVSVLGKPPLCCFAIFALGFVGDWEIGQLYFGESVAVPHQDMSIAIMPPAGVNGHAH